MSEAYWCCDTDDGNAWFDDTYFNVPNWLRGLAYMAGRVRPSSRVLDLWLTISRVRHGAT